MAIRKQRYHNKKKGNRNDSKSAPYDGDRKPSSYKDIVKENEKFKSYYKSQNLLSESEFEVFYSTLQTPLPSTFRITGSRSVATQVREFIEKYHVPKMENVVVDGESYKAPTPLPWYPDNFGWELQASRTVLRRSPEFKQFHKFIVAETEAGNLSRQEAVSMVPPLLMDIQPHQWVLDMCAAPGSKTAQIIEAVHANDKLDETPTGLVVANDSDYKRSHMLVHQTKRLQSPCFMATNHDASQFPNVYVKREGEKPTAWQFDRVLCDVPCSGDGTLRKNEKIWTDWGNGSAIALHVLQVQIFLRGAQLVKIGGKIVYSTCSFNPLENEAVVAEVLRLSDGALEIKDVSDQLPALRRHHGLSTWKVMTKDGQYIQSVDDIQDARQRGRFPKSAFPPENADSLHLDRCLRIYPQDQNTGGFFVAVFEKVKPMTAADRIQLAKREGKEVDQAQVEAAEAKDADLLASVKTVVEEVAEEVISQAEDASVPADTPSSEQVAVPVKRTSEEPADPQAKKVKADVPSVKEAPFDLMKPDNPDIDEIRDFYGIEADFPRDQYLLRSELVAKNRSVYFISKAVKAVLEASNIDRLHVVNTGVRLFVRQGSLVESGSPFRVTSEGLPMLERIISDRRRVHISHLELKTLLTQAFPTMDEFDPETATRLEAMDRGCCIVHIDVSSATDAAPESIIPMTMPVWLGKRSLNVLLNKQDKASLCQRIFDLTPEKTPAHLQARSIANAVTKDSATSPSESSEPAETA
ncbi:S-adenosyl-L-methionine-dependent methyltransferase [Spinellus fusiger]|nr:S-adenosyl-L-methionine-dependent methyltransferase [Spinellus fusiger]